MYGSSELPGEVLIQLMKGRSKKITYSALYRIIAPVNGTEYPILSMLASAIKRRKREKG